LRFDVACINWGALPSAYPSLLKSAVPAAPGTAQSHRRRRHSSHQETVYFLGSARRSQGQQVIGSNIENFTRIYLHFFLMPECLHDRCIVFTTFLLHFQSKVSAYDWSDFGWVVSRAAAETVFGAVHEHGVDGCGRLMHPVDLEAACVSAANHSQQCQARPPPPLSAATKLLSTISATATGAPDASWLPVTRCKFYECIVNARLFRLHGSKAVWLNPLDSGWKCSKVTDDHERPTMV